MLSLLAYLKSDPSPFSVKQNWMPGSWFDHNSFIKKRRAKCKHKRKDGTFAIIWKLTNETNNFFLRVFFKEESTSVSLTSVSSNISPIMAHYLISFFYVTQISQWGISDLLEANKVEK